MKTARQILPVCLTAVIAFALGRIIPHAPDGADPGGNQSAGASGSKASPGIPESSADSSKRPRERPTSPKQVPGEPMVTVPLAEVKSALAGHHFMFVNVNNAGGMIDNALALMGATEDQRQQAQTLMQETRERLRQEEQRHFKISSVEPSRVLVDTGDIEKAANQVLKDTRNRFREILPADKAEILIDSMQWERYYPLADPLRSSQATFGIERMPDNSLIASFRYTGGSQGVGVDTSRFPDDGKPIPAGEVFEERWRPLLRGIELLPADPAK